MSFREAMKGRISAKLRWPVERHFPYGVYFARDFKRSFPHLELKRILDVGAHHGESAIAYSILFPHARIDCFEPVSESFAELEKYTSGNARVHCHNYALGSQSEDSYIDTSAQYSSTFRISAEGNEKITVKTLVEFCIMNDISRIDFLKIDTEGFDLEVLKGAEALIRDQKIDFIQVEASMNPENDFHVYFENFTSYLHDYGYRIFGIYDQTPEPSVHAAKLRRANIVFTSSALILDSAGRI